MHRTHVSDLGIKEIGYHEESEEHGTLELEFESGHVYWFFNVPPEIHDKLMHANSRESYYELCIRSRFPNKRVL